MYNVGVVLMSYTSSPATVFRHAYVPHTHPHIPCSLRDDSPAVRKNTLVVLTHLILNDMIKVKGQISAMALCLEDPEQKIADLAKLFFHELSKKVSICTHLKLPNQYTWMHCKSLCKLLGIKASCLYDSHTCVAVYLSIVVCVVLLDKKFSWTCNFCYICGWSPVGLILWKYYLQNNHCYTVHVCVCTSQVAIISLIHCNGASTNILSLKITVLHCYNTCIIVKSNRPLLFIQFLSAGECHLQCFARHH